MPRSSEAQLQARIESISKNIKNLEHQKYILEHPPNYAEMSRETANARVNKIREDMSALIKKRNSLRTELANSGKR